MVQIMSRTTPIFAAWLLFQTLPAAGDPAAIVESVRPNESFHHEIEVKFDGDKDFRTIAIVGPRFWCKLPEQGSSTDSPSAPTLNYNWYKVVDAGSLDAKSTPIYFLTPATVLGQAKADGGDTGNMMIATANLKAQQSVSERQASGQFILRPVVQRHHDEIFPIKEPRHQYLVKTTSPNSISGEINTIDQFGLHSAKRLSTPYRVESVAD